LNEINSKINHFSVNFGELKLNFDNFKNKNKENILQFEDYINKFQQSQEKNSENEVLIELNTNILNKITKIEKENENFETIKQEIDYIKQNYEKELNVQIQKNNTYKELINNLEDIMNTKFEDIKK
jgi:hypothetical protein